jgi:hypothetical protein
MLSLPHSEALVESGTSHGYLFGFIMYIPAWRALWCPLTLVQYTVNGTRISVIGVSKFRSRAQSQRRGSFSWRCPSSPRRLGVLMPLRRPHLQPLIAAVPSGAGLPTPLPRMRPMPEGSRCFRLRHQQDNKLSGGMQPAGGAPMPGGPVLGSRPGDLSLCCGGFSRMEAGGRGSGHTAEVLAAAGRQSGRCWGTAL